MPSVLVGFSGKMPTFYRQKPVRPFAMADNYLGKKFEDMGKNRPRTVVKRTNPSLDTLLKRNRSTRGYDPSRSVSRDELESIVSVNTMIASSGNRQLLRFRIVSDEKECADVLSNVKMGASLEEMHLPLTGQEPPAYIVVCSPHEDRLVDIDLGISLQSMALRSVEMGLRTLIICSFNTDGIRNALSLEMDPLAVLAVGKGCERTFLLPVHQGDSLKYYRKDGVHFVPKLSLEDLLL